MAALRDMEESETHLPSSSPNHPDDSSASGPPVLENSSGRVGGQFPLQSLHTAGEEARVASKSAGHTPYPNATILFESGNNEDDDIKCGRCENPITYCHCSPTMLPPQINMSTKKTTKKPRFPSLKPPTKKIGRWRYVSAEEWAERQMTEEEFRRIAEGCTHLGPRSARRAVPYPPLPMASYATEGRTTSLSISPPLTGEASPQPSGSRSVWE
jgi:hypothetical protein